MTDHLQRLYDAAAGAATAGEARPAQRSSSPLLAIDQRLASPAYAGSFLLGLPGAADPEAAPPPEPDLLTVPPPVRRDPLPDRDAGPVPVPPPPPVVPETPRSDVAQQVTAAPRPEVRPVPHVAPPPVAESREPSAAPPTVPEPATQVVRTPPEPSSPPSVEPVRRSDPTPSTPVQPVRRSAPAASTAVEPRPRLRVDAPSRPVPPGRLRAVPSRPTESTPEPRPAEAAAVPAPVRPRAAATPEPLPLPPAPRGGEPSDLTEQVRRLVREAMGADGADRRTTRDRDTGPVAEPAATASPARTAEAVSVIGPLDRPARATTLFGLRLR